MIKQFIKRILLLNIIFLTIMLVYRTIFIFYCLDFHTIFKYLNYMPELFVLSTKYDGIILAYINLLVVLFFIIFWFIGNQKIFLKFVKSLKFYYTIVFGFIVTLLCIDFGFYLYFYSHIDYKIFEIFNFTILELYHFSKNEHILFLIMFIVLIFILIFIFKISKYIIENNFHIKDIRKKLVLKTIILILFGIFYFNISLIKYDANYEKFEGIIDKKSGLSTYYTFMLFVESPIFETYKVFYNRIIEKFWIKKFKKENNIKQACTDYFEKDINEILESNIQSYLSKTTKYNKNKENTKLNVILIVMESLGMDLLKYNSDNFNILGEMKKHFDEDIVFYNCLYSYENTIPSLDVIFHNLFRHPHLITRAFSIHGENLLQNVYEKKSFTSYCLYRYELNLNFNYELLASKVDEEIMNKTFNILEQDNNKKFIFVMTQTAHYPFILPIDYNVKNYILPYDLRNIRRAQINAQQYACQKVGEFLTKLKSSKYADNTIVAVVGDHGYSNINDDNILTNKSVPFYLYIPEKLKPSKKDIDTTRVVSHLDVLPTLYELSLSSAIYWSMGTNVFDKNYQNAISSNYNYGMIVNGDDMCRYDVDKDKEEYYKLKRENNKLVQYEQTEPTQKHKKMLKQYKAGIAISLCFLDNAKKNKEK